MLEANNIEAFYGKIQILWDVSIKINIGELVTLIGSNGAGKTTLLNIIFGLIRPKSGIVKFMGKQIDRLLPHQIVRLGISYIPEGGKLFNEMTVLENLEMGAYIDEAWTKRKEMLHYVYGLFPRLKERKKQLVGKLSGGERQMVAIGRALMSRPRVCIFDEPSYGLAPLLVKEIFIIIQELHKQGITILLVEQNVHQTLEISDRAYLLENGRIVLEDESKSLLQNTYVKKAYLGL